MSTHGTDIQTILKNPEIAGKITFQLSGSELVRAIKEAAKSINKPADVSTSEDQYLTTEQVGKMLNVSRVTLWDWNKKGTLRSFKIGRMVRYKLSDVQRIAEGGKE